MNTVIVNDGVSKETIENVIAHQVGTGFVLLMKDTGVQRVIANYATVDIIPDQEEQEKSLKRTEEAYSKAAESETPEA